MAAKQTENKTAAEITANPCASLASIAVPRTLRKAASNRRQGTTKTESVVPTVARIYRRGCAEVNIRLTHNS